MPIITDDIQIDVPADDVFEYMATPENHLEIIPSLVDIENVEDLSDGGHEGDFTYKIVGVTVGAHFRDVELVPPDRRVYEITGEMEGTISYRFEPEGGGTRVTIENDAVLPGPAVLDSVTGPVARRYLERETTAVLGNTKTILEQQHARTQDTAGTRS